MTLSGKSEWTCSPNVLNLHVLFEENSITVTGRTSSAFNNVL